MANSVLAGSQYPYNCWRIFLRFNPGKLKQTLIALSPSHSLIPLMWRSALTWIGTYLQDLEVMSPTHLKTLLEVNQALIVWSYGHYQIFSESMAGYLHFDFVQLGFIFAATKDNNWKNSSCSPTWSSSCNKIWLVFIKGQSIYNTWWCLMTLYDAWQHLRMLDGQKSMTKMPPWSLVTRLNAT